MIAHHRNCLFGLVVTRIHTASFNCVISTAKEGLFEGLSTIVFEGDNFCDGYQRACGKIIYSSALRKSDVQDLHNHIVCSIDSLGESGHSLSKAFDTTVSSLKKQGLVAEVINLASGY